MVADGRVAGTWQADGDALMIELFSEAGAVDRTALDAEVAVLERVIGRRFTTSVVTI